MQLIKLLFILKKSATLIFALLSVNNLNNIKNVTNIKTIFCDLNNLILKNKLKINKITNPTYKVRLGLIKHINKKIINAKEFINLL